MSWLRKNKLEVIVLSAASLLIVIAFHLQKYGFQIVFLDSDDHMRLVRIREFFRHFDLSNAVVGRSNVPYGCELHWTRFYDFFLIIPSYVLNLFLNSIDKSIEYVGFFITPVVRTVDVALFLYVAQKILKRDDAFLASVLFLANCEIAGYGLLGRPDHHAFIMMFMLIYLIGVIGIIESNFSDKMRYVTVAVISALCVWIAPETLIPLLLGDVVLFMFTFAGRGVSMNLYLKNIITMLIICLILLPDVLPAAYDKISSVHLNIFLFSALFFRINSRQQNESIWQKIIMAVLSSVVLGLVFLCIYPKFFSGMAADVSPYVREIWLSHVEEMMSPFQSGVPIYYLCHAVIVIIAAGSRIVELRREEWKNLDILWWMLIVTSLCYTALAGVHHRRMMPYSVLFSLPLVVKMCLDSGLMNRIHRLLKVLLVICISSFLVFITPYFGDKTPEPTTTKKKNYNVQELYAELDRLSETPVVIMSNANNGPEILYYTKHSVVAAPYHRQRQGIISSFKVLDDKYDKDNVQEILRATDSSYIFIKKPLGSKPSSEKKSSDVKKTPNVGGVSLTEMLMANNLPKWLQVVNLPPKFDDVLLVKILRKLMD
ncbi:MAG: hypothetical protein LBB63_01885 [Holosporaceae bacterium]|jgi:hypothetical protein|nr:hypothetical protein [Holosporaceae bacterium]